MRAVVGDSGIGEQWRIKNRNLQSGAVLWLRHSFARAFFGDSLLGDSLPVDCFAYARNDTIVEVWLTAHK